MPPPVPISDLGIATYCPRKLYYARRDERAVPPDVVAVRDLAFEYDALLDASAAALDGRPIDTDPDTYRERLRGLRDRFGDAWPVLVDPPERDAFVEGQDCRGRIHKILALDGPVPAMLSGGEPPDQGVWRPDAVRAVAAAKAIAWREQTPVERAFVEYPAHGVIREVAITTRRAARYRQALRTVRALDGPPPRIRNDAKCDACDYSPECGVRTRTLRSLLG